MTHSLYQGEVILDFIESKHWYKVNGDFVPSVTGITKAAGGGDALIYWAVNCACDFLENAIPVGESITLDELRKAAIIDGARSAHRKAKAKALTIGEQAHEWVEKYIKSRIAGERGVPELPVNTQIRSSVEAFLDWESQNKVSYRLSERKIYSKQYNYAGTLDIEAETKDGLGVIDIKTSTGIWTSYKYQVAAYQNARVEETNDTYTSSQIVRIPKDGGDVESYMLGDEYRTAFEGFLGCLVLYNSTKALERNARRVSK